MDSNVFSARNFRILGLSVALLVLGYILLGQGPVYNHLSWTVAPLILVFVYCVLLPLSIIVKGKKDSGKK
ncbi:MAG: hypothetical protein GF418_13935 [Chitinivibrionales bacterium]|nr:hypothetical protein [Chitinivibrionales bacterium]MBD3396720.1 hypothetical protein [Chitinivibrionales bacterium]